MYTTKNFLSAPLGFALLAALAVGCSSPQKAADPPAVTQPPPPPSVESKPPTIGLRIDAINATKGNFELQPSDALRAGDRMAVQVTSDVPAYVYVALATSGVAPKLVYPSGDQPGAPTQAVRVPQNPEKWIILDKQTGQEDVFVYASAKPIPPSELTNLLTADAEQAKKAAAKKAAAAKPAVAKPKSGKGKDADALGAGSRGVQIESDEPEAPAAASTNPSIVSKKFSVNHR